MTRLTWIFITMLLCYGLGSFMVCADLAAVPVHDPAWARGHPDWRTTNLEYSGPMELSFRLGDGKVTALENILIWIPLLFGFLRTVDLVRCWQDMEKEERWLYFWGLCE